MNREMSSFLSLRCHDRVTQNPFTCLTEFCNWCELAGSARKILAEIVSDTRPSSDGRKRECFMVGKIGHFHSRRLLKISGEEFGTGNDSFIILMFRCVDPIRNSPQFSRMTEKSKMADK